MREEGPGLLQEEVLAVPHGRSAGAHLNLIGYPNKPMPAPGETVIGFMVDDVEATVGAFRNAGGQITVPPVELPDPGLRHRPRRPHNRDSPNALTRCCHSPAGGRLADAIR